MAKAKTAVGLDVHATKIVAAVLDTQTGELQRFSMNGETGAAAGFCAGLPTPLGRTAADHISSSVVRPIR